MSTGNETAAIDTLLTPIARKHMSIATLATRNSNAFDFPFGQGNRMNGYPAPEMRLAR